jgi:pyruvate,water dikinase
MVNARTAGIMFTIEPNSGNENMISIDASWGLGETIVGGAVVPDTIWVFKQTCELIKKTCGSKQVKLIPTATGTMKVETTEEERGKICMLDGEIKELARSGVEIENHYKAPMDIEWGIDQEGKLWILQARPETVYSVKGTMEKNYILKEEGEIIVEGRGIGRAIGSGEVRVIEDIREAYKFKPGEVLVTSRTTPDWVPIMERAAGIVTEEGGPTCHAAIVSREMGKPCIVGVKDAIEMLGGKA